MEISKQKMEGFYTANGKAKKADHRDKRKIILKDRIGIQPQGGIDPIENRRHGDCLGDTDIEWQKDAHEKKKIKEK